MSIIIISDLHLEESRPVISDLFLHYLGEISRPENTLYILGDFFEAWIGDDDLTPFHMKIIQGLRAASDKGLPIYFMHGNRDFLIGKRFAKATGCRLLPDEHVINLYGTPTLLMHGDTLCIDDIKYMKFRKKMRNWFVQKLILMKSLEKRRAIAKKYREASQAHLRVAPDYIMDVNQGEVERIMLKHHVEHLIHGHTHRQAIHTFNLNALTATRTVLGAWHEHGNAFICDVNGERQLIDIR